MNNLTNYLKSLQNSITSQIIKWSDRRTVLLKGNGLYRLGDKTKAASNAWAAVVGVEHYSIDKKSYPISRKSSLRRVLKREYGPYRTQFFIGDLSDGKRNVEIITFRENVDDSLPKSVKLVIPEHLVFDGEKDGEGVEYSYGDTTFWFLAQANGPVAGISGGVIRTRESFEHSVGTHSETHWQSLTFENYRSTISNRLIAIPPSRLLSFWRTDTSTFSLQALIKPSIGFFVAILLYLFMTSVWLEQSVEGLKTQALELSSEASEIYAMADTAEELSRDYEQFKEVIEQPHITTRFWFVIGNIVKDRSIKLSQIYYSDRVGFIIEGTAPSATGVLAAVRGTKTVVEAGFNQPTSTSNEDERFSIAFRLSSNDTLSQNAPAEGSAEKEETLSNEKPSEASSNESYSLDDMPAELQAELEMMEQAQSQQQNDTDGGNDKK